MNKYTEIRRELMKTLRGKRTQGQINQKLHFKGNQVYRWEAGTQSVGWQQFVNFCKVCRADLHTTFKLLLKFEGNPESTRELAKYIVGSAKISQFCEKMKLSRFKVSRWLSGKSDFTVDEVLELVDKSQSGLFDFVYHLTNGAGIPSCDGLFLKREFSRGFLSGSYSFSCLISSVVKRSSLSTSKLPSTPSSF